MRRWLRAGGDAVNAEPDPVFERRLRWAVEAGLVRAHEAQTRHYRVSTSEHYLLLRDFKNPMASAAVAALAELASHSFSGAVIAGLTTELAQRYRHLKTDEMAVLDVLTRLAQGGSVYKVWIAEDELLATMDHEMEDDARKRLLANMVSRGILEEGAGKWRAIL
jgi:hypothetical protein